MQVNRPLSVSLSAQRPRFLTAALLPVAMGFALSAFSLVIGIAAHAADPAGDLSPSTLSQIAAIEKEAHSRTAVEKRLDSHLLNAYRVTNALPTPLSAIALNKLEKRFLNSQVSTVSVDIHALVTPDLTAKIAALGGGNVVEVTPGILHATLPINKLLSFAALQGVSQIMPVAPHRLQTHMMRDDLKLSMPIPYVQPNWKYTPRLARFKQMVEQQLLKTADYDSTPSLITSALSPQTYVDSQGDIAHRATLARSTYNITGAGIKIGVMSDSVDYLAAAQQAGQLPAVTVLAGQSGVVVGSDGTPQNTGEGTAMLEIVHDLAPGASLYFATAYDIPEKFALNILALRDAGCNIICDDVGYFNESPFAVSPIEAAVENVASSGVTYLSAAGNDGNKEQAASTTWTGDFVDSGTTNGVMPGKIHQFATGVTSNKIIDFFSGDTELDYVDLFWTDPLLGSTNDYNLYVVNSSGTVIDSSTNVQDGSEDPFEEVDDSDGNPIAGVGDKLVIVLSSGVARYLYLDIDDQANIGLTYSTNGSIRGHSAAVNGFGIGGIDANGKTSAFTAADSSLVDYYSQDGPRRLYFNTDGTPVTPGNFSSTGGVSLQKPEFIAADGVNTNVATTTPNYFQPFYGTSAATPHAAAIAGLLLQRNPSLTTSQLRTLMENTAIHLTSGWDPVAGYGILDAYAAATSAAPTTATIEGRVYNDANANGTIDSTEAGISGVTVYLDSNGNGSLDSGETSTTTNANGYYTLTSLSPASYTVRIVAPTGYYQTAPTNASGITLAETAGVMSSGENFLVAPSSFGSAIQNVLLNHSPDNQFAVWYVNGSTITTPSYGPYPGWVASALATGSDNNVHLLLNHTADNQFSLWNMASASSYTVSAYGPYAGWKAVDVTVTPNGHVHLLLNHTADNQFSLWDMTSASSFTVMAYGPYAGWQALKIAAGPDGHVHVLLDHTADHQESVWDMTSASSFTTPSFGPFSGYKATGIAVKSNNHVQIVWSHPADGAISLWDVATPTSFTYTTFGPYSGWTAQNVSTTSNGHVHLGWNNTSGAFSLWDMTSPTTFATPSYGPYTGWTDVEAGGH